MLILVFITVVILKTDSDRFLSQSKCNFAMFKNNKLCDSLRAYLFNVK